MYETPSVPLNDTSVIFLHQDDLGSSSSYVVQITLKSAEPESPEFLHTYAAVQHELNQFILQYVSAHLKHPMPEYACFEGANYALEARRAPWIFGQSVEFVWGKEKLKACEDKWVFVFEAGGSSGADTD
ncbi:uncharacterized protein BXZ73DRAFT_105489 [Epithele typhae]|uniref:uncharacterized protein n=1 Tax=Epithele typhae TaxID=378194 RepID=UPI002007AB9F|nr:uncharacterized protein BXZ73DRAFT_105489 [Epithele typhae]KAH9917667.1 hypothetical protein BXZ73DRAFT_105489 [Epithele typhae]